MIAWRILRAVLLAGAGAVVTLAQLNRPRGVWDGLDAIQWSAVALLVLLTIYEATAEINLFVQAKRIREYDSDVRAVLSATVVHILRIVSVDWTAIEVRYYRRIGRRLHQIGAVMAGADVDHDKPPVKVGSGLVGAAFAAEEHRAEEWSAFVQIATNDGRKRWNQRSAEQRYNLTWAQLHSLNDSHQGMIARPTFARGRRRGCIVVGGAIHKSDLMTQKMQEILNSAAASSEKVGSPPLGWKRLHGR